MTLMRTSVPEAVVKYFSDRIENGELKPGDKLPGERILQEQLGVSRFALREGLARLSALGLISIRHGKGAVVNEQVNSESLGKVMIPMLSQLDEKKLENLFHFRRVVDAECAALAAERADTKVIDSLSEIVGDCDKSIDNVETFADADFRFHQAVAEASENEFFMLMSQIVTPHLRAFLSVHAEAEESRRIAVEGHRKIVERIQISGNGR